MQHTTNYNLNQWEAADRVTRADVNADNAAIDAAAAAQETAEANAPGLRLLYDLHPDTTCDSYTFSFPDIDWDAWKCVHIIFEPHTTSNRRVYLNCNGEQLLYVSGNYGDRRDYATQYARLTFEPYYCGLHFAFAKKVDRGGNSSVITFNGAPFPSITSMTATNEDTTQQLIPSTIFQIWGEK